MKSLDIVETLRSNGLPKMITSTREHEDLIKRRTQEGLEVGIF